MDAMLRQPVAQRRRKCFATDQRLAQRRHVDAALDCPLHQDLEEARRARVTMRPKVGDRLQLQLGIAHPGGKHGAADRIRARFDHRRGGCQVIAEAVVQQIAGAKTGGMQGAADAPVVGARSLRFIDRPWRLEHPPCATSRSRRLIAPAHRRQAAEHVAAGTGACPFEQLVLAQHRQPGKRRPVADLCGIDRCEQLRVGGGMRARMRQLALQRGHRFTLPLLGVAPLERIERRVHGGFSRHDHSRRRAVV